MDFIATENQAQIALVKWASYHPICRKYLIHIENERQCTRAQGNLRKLKGVRAGVSDLFLAYPTQNFNGFWIELKKLGKKPTIPQLMWIRLMRKVGYAAEWFDNWENARIAIEDYLKG